MFFAVDRQKGVGHLFRHRVGSEVRTMCQANP